MVKKPVMKSCESCGNDFTVSREWQKFCSSLCANKTRYVVQKTARQTVVADLRGKVAQLEERLKRCTCGAAEAA